MGLSYVPANARQTMRVGSQKKNMHRYMICLVVDMDESSLDVGQNLNLVLKLLTDIVRFP